jgi:hypothetical protein
LKIDEYLRGQNFAIVHYFMKSGHKDFIFVDRDHPGLMYLEKSDSCHESGSVQFIISKTTDNKGYEFIKYSNCGQGIRATTNSKALPFFEKNRMQIRKDSVDLRIIIDHTVFYSFYEFKDGNLSTYKHFCKECIDTDDEKSTREKNQGLSLYKFLTDLDKELTGLIR